MITFDLGLKLSFDLIYDALSHIAFRNFLCRFTLYLVLQIVNLVDLGSDLLFFDVKLVYNLIQLLLDIIFILLELLDRLV